MRCFTIPLREDKPEITLTAYLWDASPELPSQPRPAVLICPGGGYLYLSDREAEPIALRFMAMGYQAFVLRYSIFRGEGSEPQDCVYPEPILDVGRAMLAIRAHAEDWRVDAARVAVCGFSAGGHNVLMYARLWNAPALTEPLACAPEDIRPAACIAGYPVTDGSIIWNALPEDDPIMGLFRRYALAIMGTEYPSEAQVRDASPALGDASAMPPTFLWATSEDGLVNVRHTLHMAEALSLAGVPFEVHIFEKGGHGLALADQTTTNHPWEWNEDAAGWINLCGAWLRKRFALAMPED